MATTLYLLVFDMNAQLFPENCEYLGLPEGSNFELLRSVGTPYNGYFKKKDGNDVWVLPFYYDSKILFNPVTEYYQVLTKEELLAFGFDEEVEEV